MQGSGTIAIVMAPDDSISMRDITRILALAMREAGLTRQALEARLGWSSGAASRLLAGDRELRVRQLLAILKTIGMRPSKFFSLVETAALHEDTLALRAAILRILSSASEPAEEEAITDAELDARIERMARRILASRNPAGA